MSPDTVERGTYIPPEVKQQFDSLRTFFDATATLDRIDSYGKWIFASSAIVGALAAGFSSGSLPKTHGWSLLPLTASVLCLGISLVAASRSIAPQIVEVSLNDLDSMREAVNAHVKGRQRSISFAARFYALALFLAALVPLSSVFSVQNSPRLTYAVDATGALVADVLADGVKPGSAIELDLAQQGTPLAAAGAVADSTGSAHLHLGPLALAPGDTAIVLRQRSSSGAEWKELQRIPLHR